MLLIIVVLFLQITATTGTECSDAAESNNIPYIGMCEHGSVTSDKVIVDTHNAGATGETTCSCTVNATLIFTIYIQHFGIGLNPNTSGCGSEVVVRDSSPNSDRSFTCNTFPGSPLYSLPVNITWSGGSGGDSKYCLNITGLLILRNTTFTITCSKPSYPTTPTSTTTTKATTVTSTTFTQGDVNSYGTTTDLNMNSPTKPQTTSTTEMPVTSTETSAILCSCEEEGTMRISVPAFATIIVFLCLIMLYATIATILYQRRYLSLKKQHKKDNTNATTSNIPSEEGYVNMPVPPSSDRTYEGLELAHVDLSTNTYEVLGNSGM